MNFIKALKRKSLISILVMVATLTAVACAQFKENQNPQQTSFSDAKTEDDIFEQKDTLKKPLYPTVATPAVKHDDQIVQSPDGKGKLLLHSFTIKNSNADFNKDSQKIRFTGTADFDSFRNLGHYDFDLRGQISKSHAVLYPLKSPSTDQPKIFAIVVCNHYDSKTHPTCDSFFIDVYFKFSQYSDELFDEQVADCAAGDSCLSLKEDPREAKPSVVVKPPDSSPEATTPRATAPVSAAPGAATPDAVPLLTTTTETPAEAETVIVENEEQDENFTPGGFTAYNQPENIENLMAAADQVGEKDIKIPRPKIDPQQNLKKAKATILDFPFNVEYPTQKSPEQVEGTQIGGHLKNATELVEPSVGEAPTFFIDDNSKSIGHPEKKKTFGTFYAVDFVKKLAEFSFNTFKIPLRVNDLSYREGGLLKPHDWHRIGLDVDIEYNNFRAKHVMTTEEKWIIFQAVAVSPIVNQILVSPETKIAVMKFSESRGDNDFKSKEAFKKIHAECNHPTHFHINFACAYNRVCDQNELGLTRRYILNQSDTYAALERLARKCGQSPK